MLRPLLRLIPAVAAAACTSRPPAPSGDVSPGALGRPSPFSTVYTCADSIRFSVRPTGRQLVLTLPERSDTLTGVEAASGARYAGGGLVFWSRGEVARLEANGRSYPDCHGRPAGDPWEEAALMGVAFRALGQEPGWVLDVVPGRWIRYIGDYGGTRVFAQSPRETVSGAGGAGGAVYEAESGGRRLQVELREEPCDDAMSGERFAYAVTVRVDDRTVEGCGRMTPPGELTNKYWKLTELDGRPAVVGGGREPHLRLQAADSHVAGSTGCNSLSGSFTRDGDHLTFGPLATTLMACADTALAGQEQRLTAALAAVDRWAAVGDRLTLYAKERPVARFVAVYFQ